MVLPKIKSPKIAINASMLDDHPSGIGIYSYHIVNNIARLCRIKDVGVTVFAPQTKYVDGDVTRISLPSILKSSEYGKIAAMARFIWNTIVYPFQARQFNLVFSPTTHGSFFSKNQVITIHDLLSLKFNNINFHQRLYFKYFLKFLISSSKKVITVSESSKKDIVNLLKCPPEKVKVIHNGYDENRYHALKGEADKVNRFTTKPFFLAVGPTYPHKNTETLIEAFGRLPFSVRESNDVIIVGGKEPYLSRMRRYAASRDFGKSIRFVGYVDIEEMAPLYRNAIALVYPSLYEGFGFPLLEAMGCGCPVIASKVSSIPEVCGDACLYVNPREIRSVTAAMELVLTSPQIRSSLVDRGLNRCKDFSWRKCTEDIASLLINQFN